MQTKLISIITPSFNQAQYIERNIASVLQQDYPAVEHIMIDGGSTDNTVKILHKYPHLYWISEKDNGQSDALNKGLKIATGEIIGWLNSDDFYEQDIFKTVAKEFEDQNVQWVIGNLKIFYEENKRIIPIKSPTITQENLLKDPDIVKQQPTFFRKSILDRVGGWDASFYMAMDYDLWVRLSKISTPKMMDRYWAFFVIQAEQKSLGKNLLRQLREILIIMKREGAPGYYTMKVSIRKYIYFIKYCMKRFLIRMGLISPNYLNMNLIHRNKY
jgi:glycosyltransferase involved in cell wall biosynthesis